jgi:hypothetical protein
MVLAPLPQGQFTIMLPSENELLQLRRMLIPAGSPLN